VVAEIQDYVDRNLGYAVPAADWAACTDPDGVADGFLPLTDASGTVLTPCISLKQGGTTGRQALLRVQLPDQSVDTFFARVIGMNQIQTRAAAVAELEFIAEGGALPFVLPNNAGEQHCLGSPPGGIADDPCTGPGTGKFGVINSDFHGTDEPGTVSCEISPTATTEKLEWNTALGLDHIIVEADSSWDPLDGEDECDALTAPYIPYALKFDPGNPSDLTSGLIGDGPFGTGPQKGLQPGRLRQGGGLNGGDTELTSTDVTRAVPQGSGTVWLDNVPLWEYLPDKGVLGDVCDAAHYGPLANSDLREASLKACLASGQARFTNDILTSPRFALVPQLDLTQAQLDATTPGTAVNIKDFIPVYLHATFFNCNAGATPQCMVFETDTGIQREFFAPGQGTLEGCIVQGGGCKPNVNLSLRGLTGWVLDRSEVPEEAFGGGPDQDKPVSVLLYL
jgi:hypothetical protein